MIILLDDLGLWSWLMIFVHFGHSSDNAIQHFYIWLHAFLLIVIVYDALKVR